MVKEFENASLITWYNRSFAKTVTFNGHESLEHHTRIFQHSSGAETAIHFKT